MIASLDCYTTFLAPDHVSPQQHALQVGQQQQVWQQDCITKLIPKRLLNDRQRFLPGIDSGLGKRMHEKKNC